MRVLELCQVWAMWGGWPAYQPPNGEPEKFNAFLGDGSKISAVGRPRGGICEVHSERGVEYRHSTEPVLCEPYEPTDLGEV